MLFFYFLSRFTSYAWLKSATKGGLKQSPHTVTSITPLDGGPTDGAKRCGMLSQWHGVCCLTPQAPQQMEFNEQYSVNCEVLYFVLRLFPFKSSYEENVFYVFKCNIS